MEKKRGKILCLRICILFVIFQIRISTQLYAQKVDLDTASFSNWPSLSGANLNSKNNFLAYTIWTSNGVRLIIKSLAFRKNFEFANASLPYFNPNGNSIVFLQYNSLMILDLNSGKTKVVHGVSTYKIVEVSTKTLISYISISNHEETFHLLDLSNNVDHSFHNATFLGASVTANIIVVQRKDNNLIKIINVSNFSEVALVAKNEVLDLLINGTMTRYSMFILLKNRLRNEVWQYSNNGKFTIMQLNKNASYLNNGPKITAFEGLQEGNKRIFLWAENETDTAKVLPKDTPVDIWNYRDDKLQSVQLVELQKKPQSTRLLMSLNLYTNDLRSYQNPDEQIVFNDQHTYALSVRVKGHWSEKAWNTAAQPKYHLLDENGKRKPIQLSNPSFSRDGNYIIYFDTLLRHLYSYALKSDSIKKLTGSIESVSEQTADFNDLPSPRPSGLQIADWIGNEMLVYDDYDIWKIDPENSHTPICVTHGVGRKQHIIFRLRNYKPEEMFDSETKELLIDAFDLNSKFGGFYLADADGVKALKKLVMGPYHYQFNGRFYSTSPKREYLISRESFDQSMNYFATKNFRSFRQLTFNSPEKRYSWFSARFYKYKSKYSTECSGVLYAPEKIDTMRKYPVIILYYEKKSDGLFQFKRPDFSRDEINIPWYVSNGYLVFTPDIQYKTGFPGESALQAVESATNFLSAFSYVDKNKIGLDGHSFGGFETAYIVTHSNMFAAALQSSGPVNLISGYNSVMKLDGYEKRWMYDWDQFRMGDNLWHNQSLYTENSPILKADRITTPLLMMNNKDDAIVPFSQGVEFFTALRRLHKKVWMLQYDGQGHSVFGGASRDFSIRTMQFFNHYLKGLPAPKWMTKGIPASMKGIDNGYVLDPDVEP